MLAPATPPSAAGWQAALALRFAHRPGQGTVLAQARHSGPLRVQKPLYPEGAQVCHSVLLHPPGGVAGGDQLHIDVQVAAGAHTLITTPGATRWYKAQGRPAAQRVVLHVDDDASLEWLPQENMLFAGAHATLVLDVHLAPTARAIGWDATVLGRYGAGEHWRTGSAQLRQHSRLLCQGQSLWLEQGCVQAGDAALQSPIGWAANPVCATLWAVGPGCAAVAEGLAEQLPCSPEVRAGISLLSTRNAPEVLLLRVLAARMPAARSVLLAAWQHVRPALWNLPATPPRLWAT